MQHAIHISRSNWSAFSNMSKKVELFSANISSELMERFNKFYLKFSSSFFTNCLNLFYFRLALCLSLLLYPTVINVPIDNRRTFGFRYVSIVCRAYDRLQRAEYYKQLQVFQSLASRCFLPNILMRLVLLSPLRKQSWISAFDFWICQWTISGCDSRRVVLKSA